MHKLFSPFPQSIIICFTILLFLIPDTLSAQDLNQQAKEKPELKKNYTTSNQNRSRAETLDTRNFEYWDLQL